MPDPETPDPKVEEPTTPDPKTTTADPDGGDDFDKERALATIRKQREAESDLKRQLKEAQAAQAELAKLKEADLSEQEKLAKKAQEALAKAQAADAKLQRANLIAELANPDYGIVNARAAAKLIEGVEFDDDGEPTNLGKPDEKDSLLANFLAANGFLVGTAAKPKPPSLDGGADKEKPSLNLTAEEARAAEKYGMSHEEYAVFKNGGSLADLEAAGLKQD